MERVSILIDGSNFYHLVLKKFGLKEAQIDVKLATDLIVGAVDNQYDTAIIVSSDSDLIPAIDWVRRRNKKKVEYIGFSISNDNNSDNSTKPLISLIKKTDTQRILVKSDLNPFIKQKHSLFDANAIS